MGVFIGDFAEISLGISVITEVGPGEVWQGLPSAPNAGFLNQTQSRARLACEECNL